MVNFALDSRNRLTQAGSTTYRYDPENQRIDVNQTLYVINVQPALSQEVLVKKAADGTETYYVYGLGLIGQETGGEYTSYHFDYRGSTVALTDETGSVVERFLYSPYGLLLSGDASITPFLFNGMYGVMTDDNGLYYMRARYYSPEIRRFVNQDILLGNIFDGQTLNRYAFVNGDPIKYTDPYGLDRLCGGGERSVPCPDQPHVYMCVKDSREPKKVCGDITGEYGCLLKDAPGGGNDDEPRSYVGAGGYIDEHFLILGIVIENSIISEGEKTCHFRNECASIGSGFYLGAGGTFPVGVSMSDIEDSLAGTSVGLSLDIGACLEAKGFSIGIGYNKDGITSAGSSKGAARLGVGCGLSLTVDLCEATVLWCNKP